MIKDLAVVSVEDGMLLGLRFRNDGKLLVVIDIIGSEELENPETILVQGFRERDQFIRLPSQDRLSDSEIGLERMIHMMDQSDWHSEQTAHILLHQFRPNLRSKMVSPLAALAALQQDLQSELCYRSKQRDIIVDSGSITFRSFANSGDVRTGYLCGAEAWRERSGSSTQVRLLRFEDLSIELDMAVRQELEGLGHLFALTVGAALHVEKTADLRTH